MKQKLIEIINKYNNNLKLQIALNAMFVFAFGYLILCSVMQKNITTLILDIIFFILNLLFLNLNLRKALKK